MTTPCARPAGPGAAEAWPALRAAMFRAMGTPGADDPAWQGAARGAELFATGTGQRLYAEAGFTLHEHPAMRLRLR